MFGGRDSSGAKLMTSVRPFSILLVDDDDVAAEAVVRGLAKNAMHCPITIAEDGSVALQVLRGTHPTSAIAKPYVVLLDLNMPRMNGFEFLRELRMDKQLRNTVVFVLTTSGSPAERASAYEENIAGYIVKSGVGPQLSGLARFLIEYRSAIVLP
jgi:CheY-like chemotaxis protein